MPPVLRHVANLWTLMGHPHPEQEWTLEAKLRAIKSAGFDTVCWAPLPGMRAACESLGLTFLGGIASGDRTTFRETCLQIRDAGAVHVNVQLAADHVLTPEALELTLALMQEAKPLGLLPAIESHRGTCTETPEKTYALADAYHAATGELLPISWDFSHFAVVKHLVPQNYAERLLLRPDLIQHARQFHFRPFNGHHAQVPITGRDGRITQEVLDWIPFAEAVLRCWLEANHNSENEIFLCPELGPMEGGYALSSFPNSWEDAQVLRVLIAQMWERVKSSPSA